MLKPRMLKLPNFSSRRAPVSALLVNLPGRGAVAVFGPPPCVRVLLPVHGRVLRRLVGETSTKARGLHPSPPAASSPDAHTAFSSDSFVEEDKRVVQIGDVELTLHGHARPELVPVDFGMAEGEGQETLAHPKWMLQKFSLGQDMFLLSGPGPRARRLALHFCEVVGIEAEVCKRVHKRSWERALSSKILYSYKRTCMCD